MLNEKCWRTISILLNRGDNFKYIFRRLVMDKRKSLPKCPYLCRRSRRSTPDLLFPYLPGPELFIFPPTLTVQTMPVYSTSRSGSSLDSVSPFISGYASFADLTTQSVFPPWIDWYGPTGPSTSYMAPVQSDSIISISRNPCSDIQRFYQDFRLPNYSLDTFSGRLFDVVSSTTFITGDVQTELHHAITRLIVFAYVFKFWFFLSKYTIS